VDDQGPAGLLDRGGDRVLVVGDQGAEIDDLGLDSFGGEVGGRFEAGPGAGSVGDEGQVGTLADDPGFADAGEAFSCGEGLLR
jgi:hypothetical protein